MKILAAMLGLAVVGGLAAAPQNRVPSDEAKQFARLCLEQAAALTDAQLTAAADADKACAERGEGGGAMVVPAKQFNAAALAKVGKEVLPLGQLWFRKWTPVVAGKRTPADQLRMVNVTIDDKARPMPLFFLGVRRGEKELELVVYAKDREPLLVLPLQAMDMGQELPLELEWQRGEKNVDTLTLNVAGKYRAVIPIGRLE